MTIDDMREILGIGPEVPDEDVAEAYAAYTTATIAETIIEEPISLELAKAQCRVLDDSEDDLISGYIVAAREFAEVHTGHVLMQRTVTETFRHFASPIMLLWRPVASISGITYKDSDGTAQTYVDAVYDADAAPVEIYPLTAWPETRRNGVVKVAYLAGYEADAVPQALKVAMLQMVAHWHANREAVAAGSMVEVPQTAMDILDKYRPVL
ncbi:head-tail connector protein [Sphingobium boeckii]|uniref:Putative phiE125 gp8 family phage protein n=1 Tax=Sphingobium boeckii TaxID=1082345 RepID=A0A7W9AF10_9SPHN|nr:head-tail connector protein [Sphingobium boeckii]MBB5684296.1 putative phiE125 gp8 family phage protein [Sphingobium boeckii]